MIAIGSVQISQIRGSRSAIGARSVRSGTTKDAAAGRDIVAELPDIATTSPRDSEREDSTQDLRFGRPLWRVPLVFNHSPQDLLRAIHLKDADELVNDSPYCYWSLTPPRFGERYVWEGVEKVMGSCYCGGGSVSLIWTESAGWPLMVVLGPFLTFRVIRSRQRCGHTE